MRRLCHHPTTPFIYTPHYATVPLRHCTTMPPPHYATTSHYATAPLRHRTTMPPLCHRTTTPPPHYATAPLRHRTTMPPPHCRHHPTTPPYHYATAPPPPPTMPPPHYATIPLGSGGHLMVRAPACRSRGRWFDSTSAVSKLGQFRSPHFATCLSEETLKAVGPNSCVSYKIGLFGV